jgi:uncharacterized protein YukE
LRWTTPRGYATLTDAPAPASHPGWLGGPGETGAAMTVVAVDPHDVTSAAARVRAAADEVAAAVATRRSGLAVPGQRGWQAAVELDAAATAWAEHLSAVAAGLGELAADLGAVARTLELADELAAAAWRVEPLR